MDAMAIPAAPARVFSHGGVVAGFHAAGCAPFIANERIVWTSDEATLFRSDIDAFVLQDCRLLSDLTLSLTVGRPTLFVIDDAVDFAHLSILQANREIVLTPYDAVFAPGGIGTLEGLREHETHDPHGWVEMGGADVPIPPTLSPFCALSKADYGRMARRLARLEVSRMQHFWRLVGNHAAMAQTMMRTPRMIRTGVGGPFDAITPTLLFVDPAQVAELASLPLRQSTLIVAPFAIPVGEAVDTLLTRFVDARVEPFHLYDVLTFGDLENASVGCLFGEYVQ